MDLLDDLQVRYTQEEATRRAEAVTGTLHVSLGGSADAADTIAPGLGTRVVRCDCL